MASMASQFQMLYASGDWLVEQAGIDVTFEQHGHEDDYFLQQCH